MAVEKSVNKDSKTKGGIIRISKDDAVLKCWFVTFHQQTPITTVLKEIEIGKIQSQTL